MRDLLFNEYKLIKEIAMRLDEGLRRNLLADLEVSIVREQNSDGSVIIFDLKNYVRGPYSGQHSYPIDAKMEDSDGVELSIVLYADENNRLLELEYIKWSDERLISPNFDSLEFR